MLEIKELYVKVADKTILQGINLHVQAGEVHVIMGPNGSGKSTLANVLAGRDGYEIESGELWFENKELQQLNVEQRACEGIFLSFQYPVEIPGVKNIYFIKAALNAIRKYKGLIELDALDFLNTIKAKLAELQIDENMLHRSVNQGFSGGEKKRNEILQMAMLEPKLAILDETDSGLDIDALRIVADGINQLRHPTRGMILITHYQRLLNYIEPDFVHVLYKGKIIKSGDRNLALQLEEEGYAWLINDENCEVR
jgi:Fe-S cluster assembly ATP-binding protein